MQGLWYGDRRDRVKWGALLHLAQTRKIKRIVQIAYYRHGDDPILQIEEKDVPLPRAVWEHFSDLRHIVRLGQETGMDISVFDDPFDSGKRRGYVAEVVRRLKTMESPKIAFLDPDTGIEPSKAGAKHVTSADIGEIWAALRASDILVVYQHADHTTTWCDTRVKTMEKACGGAHVEVIFGKDVASDVAMLWSVK